MPFINEINVDGTNEGIEVAGAAGTNLSGYSLAFYLFNAQFGDADFIGSISLSGIIDNEQSGFGALRFGITGIPDDNVGVALIDRGGNAVEFLSTDRAFQAFDGPIAGQFSIDIGDSIAGRSLQRVGTGDSASDFSFVSTSSSSFGSRNSGQTFSSGTTTPPSNLNSVHLLAGNPSDATTSINNRNNYLLVRDEYALSYNESRLTANWVSFQLTEDDLGSTPRFSGNFFADPDLPSNFNQATHSSYTNSGFDRGHLVPSASRTSSFDANRNTFTTSNIIPQASENNQGPWVDFENFLRSLTDTNDIYVVTGGYGAGGDSRGSGTVTRIGPGILVPSNTWQVALVLERGELPSQADLNDQIYAIDIPNSDAASFSRSTPWENFAVSTNFIESRTGFDLLENIPNSVESNLESQIFGATVEPAPAPTPTGPSNDPLVFINELHYDDFGTDQNEGFEIAGPAGLNLSGWRVELYNGNGGGLYRTVNLSGTLANQDSGHGTRFFFSSGIQNGGADGLALIDNGGNVVQFLSYEGTLTAANGTAAGLTSQSIGVSETGNTSNTWSLQLTGTGDSYADFTWANAAVNTRGVVNTGQNFV